MSVRLGVARVAAQMVGGLSRLAGQGDGSSIGGAVARRVQPDALKVLSKDRDIAIVTGTNGKSTTARLLAVALGVDGPVAHNGGGSNMENGAVHALVTNPNAKRAVLEIDEPYVPGIADASHPKTVTLLNLSRESTRGVILRDLQRKFIDYFISDARPEVIVANADDPFVVSTVPDDSRVIWVEEPNAWPFDTAVCPRCQAPIRREGSDWKCTAGDLSRPEPAWLLRDGDLHGPSLDRPLVMKFPGEWVRSNAVFALATASALGVRPEAGLQRMLDVEDVDGRYGIHDIDGRRVRLVMIKNAASWWASLRVGAGTDATVVLALESFGVKDLAPIWEVDVTALRDRRVIVTGQRRNDAAARLDIDGIPHTSIADPMQAVRAAPPGDVFVIANYTSFLELRRKLK